MDTIIRDVENGQGAHVNSGGYIMIAGYVEDCAVHTNKEHSETYSMRITQVPTAGDDCIGYIENTSDKIMIINSIDIIDVAGAVEFYIQLGDKGTRNGAVAVVPVSLNSGSGNVADGIFEQAVDLDGGAATLAGGAETHRWNLVAANESKQLILPGKIIIRKNQTLSFWANAIQEVDWTTYFHYHE
jgi:hypothetical protein